MNRSMKVEIKQLEKLEGGHIKTASLNRLAKAALKNKGKKSRNNLVLNTESRRMSLKIYLFN